MSKIKKYRKLDEKLNNAVYEGTDISNILIENSNEFLENSAKQIETFSNLDSIVDEIDADFAKQTSIINPKDQAFLWSAVAIQTVRQFFQPELSVDIDLPDKSHRGQASTAEEKKLLKDKSKSFQESSSKDSSYIEKEDYYKRPVPYDAMIGPGARAVKLPGVKSNPNSNLTGKTHHAATLGHDPVLGYVFGTMNIMTSTITFNKRNLQTNEVVLKPNTWQQTIEGEYGFFRAFSLAIQAEMDDNLRIPFAVGRHQIHLSTDKGTKMGLPIPFLSAEKQQALLKKGWNSEELKKIFQSLDKYKTKNIRTIEQQYSLAVTINIIIASLHILLYDENTDGSFDLYSVRTKKIIATSASIASSINFAYFVSKVVEAVCTEDLLIAKEGIKKLDIGGYIEAVHQIASSKKLQEKIRREYMEKRLYEVFLGDELSFLEVENE